MATYYVATTGSDSNAGISTGAPWLTIAHALSASTAGDTINLRGGDTFAEVVTLTSGRTLQSYGTGRATIAGGSSQFAVTATNVDAITLSNLILTSTNHTNTTNLDFKGVVYLLQTDGSTRHANGITIAGCDISGGVIGISIKAITANTGGLNNVTITGCTIHDCSEQGILTWDSNGANYAHFSNLLITGCTIHDITGDSNTGWGTGCGIFANSLDATLAPCVIELNHVHDCGSAGAGSHEGIIIEDSDGVIIQKNVVHDITTPNIDDSGGIDLDFACTNCTIQYNYVYNCAGPGIYLFGNNDGHVVRFNLVMGCSAHSGTSFGAMHVAGTGSFTAYNNTLIANPNNPNSRAVSVVPSNAGMKFYNNLCVAGSGQVAVIFAATGGAGFDLQGNAYESGSGSFRCYYGATECTSLAAWRTATGLENAHGFQAADPLFRDPGLPPAVTPGTLADLATSYGLITGTPLVGAGLDLNSLYSINPGTLDLCGNTLGTPYSVGAIDPGGEAHMAATKSSASILNAVTTTQTSAAVDCSADYAQEVYVSIIQVGTATTPASFDVQWSPDGGATYYTSATYTAGLAAGTYYWVVTIPVTATKVKVDFTQQAGGTSSTCTAQLGQVTAV